ncbi:SH3 domain-containing protein [Jannaschia rubra]|nr:SH3 domain-containing protein [Jannaschia rubra]
MRRTILIAALVAITGLAAWADDRGPVTGLPLPRYVSMKAAEGYARRGPSSTHRIDWVFKRRNMPLLLTDEYGQWRRVQDREGAGGWMHYSLLSGNRTVIVEPEQLDLRRRPTPDSPVSARLETGVVAWLDHCEGDWCEVEVEGTGGWAERAALWGILPGEPSD